MILSINIVNISLLLIHIYHHNNSYYHNYSLGTKVLCSNIDIFDMNIKHTYVSNSGIIKDADFYTSHRVIWHNVTLILIDNCNGIPREHR